MSHRRFPRDKIEPHLLVTIFLCMIQTVISGRYANRGEEESSRRFDKISFGLIGLAYLALNVALPLAAQIRSRRMAPAHGRFGFFTREA